MNEDVVEAIYETETETADIPPALPLTADDAVISDELILVPETEETELLTEEQIVEAEDAEDAYEYDTSAPDPGQEVIISDTPPDQSMNSFEEFLDYYEQAPAVQQTVSSDGGSPVIVENLDYSSYFNSILYHLGAIHSVLDPETEEETETEEMLLEAALEGETETEPETDLQALLDAMESEHAQLVGRLDAVLENQADAMDRQRIMQNNLLLSQTFLNVGVFLIFGALCVMSVFRYLRS